LYLYSSGDKNRAEEMHNPPWILEQAHRNQKNASRSKSLVPLTTLPSMADLLMLSKD